jgi:hypothetical protein
VDQQKSTAASGRGFLAVGMFATKNDEKLQAERPASSVASFIKGTKPLLMA